MIRLNAALLMTSIKGAAFCVLLRAVGAAAGLPFEVGRFQNKSLPQVISPNVARVQKPFAMQYAVSESLMAIG